MRTVRKPSFVTRVLVTCGVLALLAGVWAPASYAEQRHRQDKVGDEWYKTDLLKVHVDSGDGVAVTVLADEARIRSQRLLRRIP